MSTLTATQLQQQYIAYFGRPGDPSGITYWLSSSSGVSSAREFADKIYAQDEYKTSTVGGKSVETQVDNLYLNLFGRSADAAGLLYWTEQIETGNLSLSNVATDLIWAASNPSSGNTAQGALDASALTNKVAAAEAYTAEVKASAAAILAYQPATTTPFESGTAFSSAVTYLGTITSSTAHTSAGITSEVSSMTSVSNAPASTTTTLTTSLDTLTGTQYADTFKALFDYGTTAASTSATISAGDKITAGLGTDTIELTVSGTLGGATATSVPAADISGLEKWYIRNTATETTDGTDYLSFDASLFPGVTEVWSDRSTATLDVNNLPTGAVFGLIGNGTTTIGDTTTFDMKTATDALTLTIDGGVVGGAATDITNAGSATTATINSTGAALNTTAGTINTVDVVALASGNDTVTSLTINATSGIAFGHTSAAAITGMAADSAITVTGAGDVTLKTIDTDVDTLDASAATGAITLTADSTNTATVITTGTGDDTITAGVNLVAASKGSIDAGAGTDKLVIGTNTGFVDTAAEAAKYSNFETLSLSGTLDMSYLGSGITAVELSAQTVLSNLTATQAANITSIANAKLTATTISLSDSSGTSDSVSIDLGNGKGAAGSAGTVVLNGFETINLTANPKSGNADLDSSIAGITSDVATQVNLYSNNLGTIGLGSVALTKIATIDASGMTGALTAAGDLVVGSTLTGSPKGDSIALGVVGSTYNGGAGADTFTGTATSTTTGITYLESSSVFNTIDGGAGTDTVAITDSAIAFVDTNFSKMSNIEIINATSTNLDGAVTFTTGGFFDAKFPDEATVNITQGDGDGTKSAVTVSASTYTGDLTLTLTSSGAGATTGETISITTGSGADTVTVTAAAHVGSTATKGGTGSITVNTGAGADTITFTTGDAVSNTLGIYSIDAGTGADTVTIARGGLATTDDSATMYIVQDGDSILGGRDKVTGFNSGDTTDFCDVLDFDTAIVSSATAATNGTDSGSIKSHSITSGVITFDDVDAFASAVTVDTANLSNVLSYLATNITTQGHTVGFSYDSNNDSTNDATIVFNQDTSDSIVELVGLTGVTNVGTEAVTANLIGIV